MLSKGRHVASNYRGACFTSHASPSKAGEGNNAEMLLQSNPGVDLVMPRTDPPISADTVSLLIDEIVAVLGIETLVTPDDLRGNFSSLREALSELGPEQFWPDVETLGGKIVIIGGGTSTPPGNVYHCACDFALCAV